MTLTEHQKYQLKKFIKELEPFRGRHTELVSVYIPQGYEMVKIIQHLGQEQGTASNIKSASTRKNVIDALERMIQHLRLFKKTPENGLAAFSGNVAEREGQSDVQVWSIEPPQPLKTRIYRCDKAFQLDLLEDMLDIKEIYGLVVMDRREGTIAFLKGKTIIPVARAKSNVPGKTRAGGQCHVYGTLVQSASGSIIKIEKCHNPINVKSMNIDTYSIKDSPITDKWITRKKEVYKITTAFPRLITECSKDHVFFVSIKQGITEKAAEELKKGDLLLMPEKLVIKGKIQKINPKPYYNSFSVDAPGRQLILHKRMKKGLLQREFAKKIGVTQTAISVLELGKRNITRSFLKNVCKELGIDFKQFLDKHAMPYKYREVKLPHKIDPRFAQFIGYILGDGCIEKDRITLFEQRKDIALYYKKMYDTYFNLTSSYRFRQKKNCYQLRFTSRPLVRLITQEFPEIKNALDSEVPEKIMNSKDDVLRYFLKGLFDAEGYCSGRVGLGMNNKMIIHQLQLLLLRFGILSSVLEYDNTRNKYSDKPRYTLEITEKRSLQLFNSLIGFRCNIKTEKLKKIISRKSEMSRSRKIIVFGSQIRKIVEKYGYNLSLFPKVSNFFHDTRMMSKYFFKNSVLNYIKDKKLYIELAKIPNYPILPVKISNIQKYSKAVRMVDISVRNRSFIANGLIVHNSAHRYERIREGAAKDFYTKIGMMMKEEFFDNKNLKGILIGGPGPTKYDFVDGNFIVTELKNKIIGIKDLSYTDEFGLNELVEKSEDILAKESIITEKKVMGKFFDLLNKKPNMVGYGRQDVMDKLKAGMVDILLLSEELEDSEIDEFENVAKQFGTSVEIISTETREGVQLTNLGWVAAILRYEVR